MKKLLLLLILVLVTPFCLAQSTDCSQGNGTFKYRARLIESIPVDFNKNDFLNFIVARDNISSQDLATLTDGITAVYRTIPSLDPHKLITIDATVDIYSILDSLENSLDIFFCVIRDCVQQDGTYSYFATLVEGPIAIDFDKEDFIAYITARDVISGADLALLNEHITTVEKAFPFFQSDFLKRTVLINATAEIYGILESLTNSLEFFECIDDNVILALGEVPTVQSAILFPNPVTEQSVLQLNHPSHTLRLELINTLGQLVYSSLHSGAESIALKNLPVPPGISFLKIYHMMDGRVEILKVVKE